MILRWRLLAVCAVVAATIRIASTWTIFTHTADEPGHLACGMHYLRGGACVFEYAPLAHGAIAIGPWLAGARPHGLARVPDEGLATLYERYGLYLTLARAGVLPFFWFGCMVVYIWATRISGEVAGAIAVCVFTLTPAVLAHAGLATADMALTGCLGAAFLCCLYWSESPTQRWSVLCGACIALAILAKFAALGFLPAGLAFAVAFRFALTRKARLRLPLYPSAGVLLTAALVFWAGYRFSFGRVSQLPFPIPAPQFFASIALINSLNYTGLPGYLLGDYSATGWWYYYEVVLAVKTPLALLVLVGSGVMVTWVNRKTPWMTTPVALFLGVMVLGLFSQINIGVRHILPVYLALSVIAALGVMRLFERQWSRAAAVLLFAWLIWSGAAKHPDYIAYFNELAGTHPETVVVDSDLDWGQDLNRLARRLHELGAKQIAYSTFFAIDLTRHGLPPVVPIDPVDPVPGWNAVSPTWWMLSRPDLAVAYNRDRFWIDDAQPVERVGAIFLYIFP